MKKLFLPILIVLLLALAACGGDPAEIVSEVATRGGDVAATAAAVATDVADGPDSEGETEVVAPTEEPTEEPTPEPTEEPTATPEPTEEPTEVPTEVPTEEPTVEVAEGESPIWAEIKSDTLQDPVVLAGVILDDASVTQQEGSVLLSGGFKFAYFETEYLDDHPLLAISAGTRGDAIILDTATTSLEDVFIPIAKSSETTLGSAAEANLKGIGFLDHVLVDIGEPNGPVMEGDLVEISLGNENSSEPPYYLTVYRGEERQVIAKFQLVRR